MFYLLLFIISAFLFYRAEKAYPRNRFKFYSLSFISLILLAFFAGCRAETIGTDTIFYGIDVFKDAAKSKTPFTDAFEDISWIEPFYFIVNWLGSCLGGFGFTLFLIMFVQLLFAFWGMKYFMYRAPLWAMMLAYELSFYNLTLNIMRQGIAIAFLLYSYRYVEKKQCGKLLLMAILGFFWHKSSIVAFFVLFALLYYKRLNEEKQKIFMICVIPACIVGVICFLSLLQYSIQIMPILGQYSAYGFGSESFESGLSTIDVGSRLMIIILAAYFYNHRYIFRSDIQLLLILVFFDVAARFLGTYTYFATRIAYYFVILEIPYVFIMLNSNKKHKWCLILNSCMIFCYGFMSFWDNIHFGNNETYPYVSKILDVVLY